MDPVEVLRHLGGSATRAQMVRQSSVWAIERALEREEIERSARGRYALPGLPKPLRTAIAFSGTLSHESAADHLMIKTVCSPTAVHVTVPRHGHRLTRKGVVLHYADLDHDETLDGERVTSPLRTVLDCARTMPFREGLAIADSALRAQLLSLDELRAAAGVAAGSGSRRLRQVAAEADMRADNPFESALRAAVVETRVGGFRPQVLIEDTGYRVDLADIERMIILEADSLGHHSSPLEFEADCRRYDELNRRGWIVLRFSWDQVMFDPEWVKEVIVDCCMLGPRQRGGTIGRKRILDGREVN